MAELKSLPVEELAMFVFQTIDRWREVLGEGCMVWEVMKDKMVFVVKQWIATPHTSGEIQHNLWVRDKIKGGWVYGETLDEAAKTHPCLVPWDNLPPQQKVKDELFVKVLSAIVTHMPIMMGSLPDGSLVNTANEYTAHPIPTAPSPEAPLGKLWPESPEAPQPPLQEGATEG